MFEFLTKIAGGVATGGRPPAACEVLPEGVAAAALRKDALAPVHAFAPLRPGQLHPGILEPNLPAPEAVAAAIQSALGEVSPRTRAVTLIVPDAAVRVFLLDFDTLPSRATEAVPILRFRLRKMVPFEVETAGISYQVLYRPAGGSSLGAGSSWRVLVAVIPGPVLAEYEGAARTAGYEPGVVLPSALAGLAALEAHATAEAMLGTAVLAANWNGNTLTTSIPSGGDLLLYRTLDLPLDPAQRQAEAQRAVAVAAAYFEDKLGAPATQMVFSGPLTPQAFAEILDYPELTIRNLAEPPETGILTPLGANFTAGVLGALMGATA